MKVSYSIGNKFADHGMGYTAYQTALQLIKRRVLDRVYCYSYAKNKIPARKLIQIVTFWPRLIEKFCNGIQLVGLPGYAIKDGLYDYLVSHRLSQTDILHGWSNQTLFSFKKSAKLKIKTVLERPNPHILIQKEIFEKEYKKYHVFFPPIHPWEIKRNALEYQLADLIIVPSKFAYKSFTDLGFPKKKLAIIPYGVDTQRFYPKKRLDKKFRCMYAGQITLHKGVQYILEAWAKLNLENAELILVGKISPSVSHLINKYQSNSSIKFYPFDRKIEAYYQMADIFVFPSLSDGFALVVSEAMACGLPVIVTPNTGASDIVKDGVNGFIVPICNSKLIKEKIGFLYTQPQKRLNMGQKARQTALIYNWDRYGNQLVKAYTTLNNSF